jgi:hypothetical protein
VPFPCQIDGLIVFHGNATFGNMEIVLYEGTTVLQTVSVDANVIVGRRTCVYPIPITTLSANTTYYVSMKPTSVTNVAVVSCDVSDANWWTLHDGGTSWYAATRAGGAWTEITTRRYLNFGVRMCAFDDAASAGGVKIAQAMTGGFVG